MVMCREVEWWLKLLASNRLRIAMLCFRALRTQVCWGDLYNLPNIRIPPHFSRTLAMAPHNTIKTLDNVLQGRVQFRIKVASNCFKLVPVFLDSGLWSAPNLQLALQYYAKDWPFWVRASSLVSVLWQVQKVEVFVASWPQQITYMIAYEQPLQSQLHLEKTELK